MTWLCKHNPTVSEHDVDVAVAEVKEIGRQYRRWAIEFFEMYLPLVTSTRPQRKHWKAQIDSLVFSVSDGWVTDIWDWARYLRETADASSQDVALNDRPSSTRTEAVRVVGGHKGNIADATLPEKPADSTGSPDTLGFVEFPADPSAYVPANDILAHHAKDLCTTHG